MPKKKFFFPKFFFEIFSSKNMIFEKCFELRPMRTHVAGLKRDVAPSFSLESIYDGLKRIQNPKYRKHK